MESSLSAGVSEASTPIVVIVLTHGVSRIRGMAASLTNDPLVAILPIMKFVSQPCLLLSGTGVTGTCVSIVRQP